MHTILTEEQILALAPDPSSAKAARGLASARKWQNVGGDARAVWGECQGSGSAPYQTQADLDALQFRCSCPSRKFPCKHGLALLLLWSADGNRGKATERPAWVDEWLAKRDRSATRAAAASIDEPAQASTSRRSKSRPDERGARVAAGLKDAELWLRDLLRQGLATAQGQPASYWNGMAARMIDAQAPGVARRIRELGEQPASGAGWHERMLEGIGQLHLLLSAYRRLDDLSEAEQWDVRTQVGWAVKQDELASQAGVSDRWLVLGQRVEIDDQLQTQRTWLWGCATQHAALVLDFAHGRQALDCSLVVGTAFDGEIVFVPSAYLQRAFVRRRSSAGAPWTDAPGGCVEALLTAYAAALAAMPWLAALPARLDNVVPMFEGAWFLRECAGDALPLHPRFLRPWELLAISGGDPILVCGEWDGTYLWPLGASASGRYHVL